MRNKINAEELSVEESRKLIGPNLNFAASEAYKRLRTNLNFSMADKAGCKIIGVTSALKGEGKSTTSINLAYTFAQTGQRVLLIEGDLRLPNIAKRLGIHARPGISNLLVGQCSGNDVLQRSVFLEKVHVITAGDIPPNPAELLSSAQMKQAMDALAQVFDVIILDLPPLTVVADAAIASDLVDGMVVVCRQNYCEKRAEAEAITQLRFTNTKILGFVVTGSEVSNKNYKRYKKNYGSYDSYGYADSANAQKAAPKSRNESSVK